MSLAAGCAGATGCVLAAACALAFAERRDADFLPGVGSPEAFAASFLRRVLTALLATAERYSRVLA
ncbi:MAG TPA: hypothetical protein VH877_07230 [Polyangia bacterium]|nr:hypothetical protein [Polyangia bacterium]